MSLGGAAGGQSSSSPNQEDAAADSALGGIFPAVDDDDNDGFSEDSLRFSDDDDDSDAPDASPFAHRGHYTPPERHPRSSRPSEFIFSDSTRRHCTKMSEARWVEYGAELGDISEEFVGHGVFHFEQSAELSAVLSKVASHIGPTRGSGSTEVADPPGPSQEAPPQKKPPQPMAVAKPRLTGTVPMACQPDIKFLDQSSIVEDFEQRARVQQRREDTSVRAFPRTHVHVFLACSCPCPRMLLCCHDVGYMPCHVEAKKLNVTFCTTFCNFFCCRRASCGPARRFGIGLASPRRRLSGCASAMHLHLPRPLMERPSLPRSRTSRRRWPARAPSRSSAHSLRRIQQTFAGICCSYNV